MTLATGASRRVWDLLGAVPERAAARIGRAIGLAAWRPLGIRRAVVEAQLATAFPERPRRWVRRTARRVYLHFGRELPLTLRLARQGPAAVAARLVDPATVRRVREAVVPAGSGCVVVTGHLGNWELAGAALAATSGPVVAAVQSQGHVVDRALIAARRGLGVRSVSERNPVRGLRAALRRGATVALVADQHAGPRGVRLPFLGRPASTFLGPARLALDCEVPLLFGALVREGPRYRALLERVDGGVRDEVELTRRWLERLEAEIRARPEQYFWFHRRWKEGGRPCPAGSTVPRNATRGMAVREAAARRPRTRHSRRGRA